MAAICGLFLKGGWRVHPSLPAIRGGRRNLPVMDYWLGHINLTYKADNLSVAEKKNTML
jgi:hypothetical protein